MADMAEIAAAVKDAPARLSALVPNTRGAKDALAAGIAELVHVFSVSYQRHEVLTLKGISLVTVV